MDVPEMPKIDVSYEDLCKLAGLKEIKEEDLMFAKCELDERIGDALKLDCKDTNRPDLWSVEGIAREIRFRYRKDFPAYKMKKSGIKVMVDDSVEKIRPYTVCAVVKKLKMTKNLLSQLIQLQEKVSGTFGRNRREVAIGVYDLDKIKPPIEYTTVSPVGIKFIPLDFDRHMTPAEIIEKHPKGKEFGHLLRDKPVYPIFVDSEKNVLSVPPIINSNHTGRVGEHTKNVFIECSGFDMKFLMPAINSLVAALHERGGVVESVDVIYGRKKITTPDMKHKIFSFDEDYVNNVTGLNLSRNQMSDILLRSGYKIVKAGKVFSVVYPAYRQDIMHARDLAEDVAISYGYNTIEPDTKNEKTPGKQDAMELFCNAAADILVGTGLQEVLSYTLTNRRDVADKMSVRQGDLAEIDNPVSSNWSVIRNWLLPSLLEFLSKNKHAEYPQKISEVGDCTVIDEKRETGSRDIRKLAVGISNSSVSYEDITSVLDALLRTLGVPFDLRPVQHASFIEGRAASVFSGGKEIGFVGEVNPQVLNNWNLEKPVAAFELDMEEIFGIHLKARKRR